MTVIPVAGDASGLASGGHDEILRCRIQTAPGKAGA